jgi:hypothetical protein
MIIRGKEVSQTAAGQAAITHGEPQTWKFMRYKKGTGDPATGEHIMPGQTRGYTIWLNGNMRYFEIHYTVDTDGVTIKDIQFKPYSA